MTTLVSELYTALKAAGVADDVARAAAQSVIAIEDKASLATKADLVAGLADLKADLTWRMFTAMGALTVIYTAINAALRFVK